MFRTTAVTLGTLLVLSCTEGKGRPTKVTQSALHGNDNPAVPQAGVLDLELDAETELVIKVSGGGEEWTLTRAAATKFHEPIVGLKPDTQYTVSAQTSADAGSYSVGPFEWTTPPLPDDFPPISVPTSKPSQMEPGMIEFNPWVNAGQRIPLVIVDQEGVVRWYYDDYRVFDDHTRLPNGNLLFTPDECVLMEVDILGHLVRSWYAMNHPVGCKDIPTGSVPVLIDSIHHQETLLPNGNILVLSTELLPVIDFPTSEDDPNAPKADTYSVGSVIVEFTVEGKIEKSISLMKLLDPTRIGRGTLPATQDKPPWGMMASYVQGKGLQSANDWDHANAVVYAESSDSYYVSLRHQDAVIKVNRTNETLTWILGTPSNWKSPWNSKLLLPVGNVQWPYHQHAVQVSDAGVGMYDNGNFGAAAFEPPAANQYSRAVIYSVDETKKTVQQTWSFGASSGKDSFFSSAMGNADWLPSTKNELIANAKLDNKVLNQTTAQILEVAQDGTRVFELNVAGKAGTWYLMHRARHIADIRQ
jgi:arylsulfate sulfotransferase